MSKFTEPEDRTEELADAPIADEDRYELVQEAPGSDVSEEMLRNDVDRADSWLHYDKGYEQIGHSPADRLTPENVGNLSREHTIERFVPGGGHCSGSGLEMNPIVVPGDPPAMYVTEGNMTVHAMNARTGEEFWSFQHGIEEATEEDMSGRNRGVAVWQDKVYFASPDSVGPPLAPELIALDRYTGEKQWETEIMSDAQDSRRIASTEAPLIYDGTVYIGQSLDRGNWAEISAIDAETGEVEWRFNVAPREEWVGDSWRYASAAPWMTPSADPQTDTVFFATANPNPMFNGVVRPGPNKHSNSILAFDAQSGELKWENQLLAHELWDYDVHTTPYVFDMEVNGETRRVVGHDNKTGWTYILDAETGQILNRTEPYATQDHWGGFLRLPPAGEDNAKEAYPSLYGATEWPPGGYSPQTGLRYIGAEDAGDLMWYDPDWAFNPENVETLIGGGLDFMDDAEFVAKVTAVDPASGEIAWEHELEDVNPTWTPPRLFTGGATPTAGNLVFHASSGGHIIALNAETGERLWRDDTGSRITASPVVWDDPQQGKQYVSVASGDQIITYSAGGGS